MKTYGTVDVQILVFSTSALVGGEWSASCPGRYTSRKRPPGTHWIRGCVGPETALDDVERRKILPLRELELGFLGRPACSQSPYPLHYPGSMPTWCSCSNFYNCQNSVPEIIVTVVKTFFKLSLKNITVHLQDNTKMFKKQPSLKWNIKYINE
jgi:hypothetical protein